MPPVVDPNNLYSETSGPEHVSPALKDDLVRVYVPNLRGNSVSVIDPAKMKVVDTLKVGQSPQHVVVGYDLRTLWAANNAERSNNGSLTPIDPRTGKTGTAIPSTTRTTCTSRPTASRPSSWPRRATASTSATRRRWRCSTRSTRPSAAASTTPTSPSTARPRSSPASSTARSPRSTWSDRKVAGYLVLPMPSTRLKDKFVAAGGPTTEICTSRKGMPQDIRFSPDGKKLYVADMEADGVHVIDAAAFKEMPSSPPASPRTACTPAATARGSTSPTAARTASTGRARPGQRAVLDFATDKIVANWPVPGGGSPDMGNVTADGKYLWLSGRYDDVVYRFDTTSGAVQQIAVGQEPHGLTVWPQPGRYSLGIRATCAEPYAPRRPEPGLIRQGSTTRTPARVLHLQSKSLGGNHMLKISRLVERPLQPPLPVRRRAPPTTARATRDRLQLHQGQGGRAPRHRHERQPRQLGARRRVRLPVGQRPGRARAGVRSGHAAVPRLGLHPPARRSTISSACRPPARCRSEASWFNLKGARRRRYHQHRRRAQ